MNFCLLKKIYRKLKSLARFGGNVVGIDPTENSINVSTEHAKLDPELEKNLKYILTTSGLFDDELFLFYKIF